MDSEHLPTYPELVAGLAKPGEEILSTLIREDYALWRMGSRALIEAAALFDVIKRRAIYRKDLDRGAAVSAIAALQRVLHAVQDQLGVTGSEHLAAAAALEERRCPDYEEPWPPKMDALKAHVWHMASCIGGEGGELMEGLEGWLFYEEELDRENLIEELGDGEFYPQGIRGALNIKREDVLESNTRKLLKRYKGGTYSDRAAQERADKQ